MARRHARFLARPLAVLALAALSAYAPDASGQEPLGIEPPSPAPPAAGGTEQAVVARYWELGRPRLFLATMLEAGYAYVRPRFAAGYGRPYWRWVGVEAYPLVSLGGLGQYAGVAAALPGVSARFGGRYYYPFSRSFLVPRESFSRLDIERLDGPKADYLALEAELNGTAPIPGGSLFAVVSGYRTFLVDDGFYVFEESLRAVMEPPYIWRARLGYLLAFGKYSAFRFGPTGEVIGLPGREEFVVRAGVLGSVAINAHLEAQASLIPVIASPDRLGIAGGDFGQLGVRFRWATGSTPDADTLRKARAELRDELERQERPRRGR
jgi:hypothetical protein